MGLTDRVTRKWGFCECRQACAPPRTRVEFRRWSEILPKKKSSESCLSLLSGWYPPPGTSPTLFKRSQTTRSLSHVPCQRSFSFLGNSKLRRHVREIMYLHAVQLSQFLPS